MTKRFISRLAIMTLGLLLLVPSGCSGSGKPSNQQWSQPPAMIIDTAKTYTAIINTEKDIAEKWTLFSHKQELLVQLSLRQNKEATPPALAEMFTARINAAYAKAKLTSLKTTAEANRMGETIANDISRIGIVDELAYLHYLGQTEVDAFLRTGLFGGIGKQQPSTSWTEERMRAISDRLAAEGEIYTKKKRRETLILGSAAAATVAVAGGAGVYAAKRYRERTR